MLKPILATAAAGVVLCTVPAVAIAAEGAKTGGDSGGMPQLDGYWFASQVFWLAVTFILFLLICWKVALPKIGRVLEERRQRIEGDLEEARTLRDEAEKVLADYEEAVAKARSDAQAIVRKTAGEMQERAAQEHERLGSQTNDMIGEAEGRIDKARAEAIANVNDVAGELAQTAAAKLLGADISRADADTAVSAVLQQRG
jgi:F-type H+-transporting ATPase subunit b